MKRIFESDALLLSGFQSNASSPSIYLDNESISSPQRSQKDPEIAAEQEDSSVGNVVIDNAKATKEVQAWKYQKRERAKRNSHASLAGKGERIDIPGFGDAPHSPGRTKWEYAIHQEMETWKGASTWEVVDHSKNIISISWEGLFELKRNAYWKPINRKRRFVINAIMDDTERSCIFAPVVGLWVAQVMPLFQLRCSERCTKLVTAMHFSRSSWQQSSYGGTRTP